MLQMTLRTLGGTSVSQTVSSGPARVIVASLSQLGALRGITAKQVS